jgi:hypothetical protein
MFFISNNLAQTLIYTVADHAYGRRCRIVYVTIHPGTYDDLVKSAEESYITSDKIQGYIWHMGHYQVQFLPSFALSREVAFVFDDTQVTTITYQKSDDGKETNTMP